MVSDNRGTFEFRICPTIASDEPSLPLVKQSITVDTCHRRQERGYHKCHRCTFHEFARVRRDLVPIPLT